MSSRQESVWPGMEAPPLPQLHATCRGYKVKDLPNVVILFFGGCNKSRQWREFIGKEIETSQEKRVGGQRLEEFGELSGSGGEDGHNRRFEEMVYHCDLVIVILSRKFIEWLQRTKIVIGKNYFPCLLLTFVYLLLQVKFCSLQVECWACSWISVTMTLPRPWRTASRLCPAGKPWSLRKPGKILIL